MKLDFDSFWINRENKAAAKKYKLTFWHKWFAWRPVRIGKRDHRWLEMVERRTITYRTYRGHVLVWEYRAIKG